MIKFSSLRVGQVVKIGSVCYRVVSKLSDPDNTVIKVADAAGNIHLAFNREFDAYINSYIERYNQQHKRNPLPYPVGRDGKAFRWANWFQKVVSPKLYVAGRGDAEDKQIIKDELIHEMLFTVLGHRDILSQFVSKTKSLGVNRQNAAKKLTDFLISTFMYRISEMQNKLQERMPEEEVSMWQPGHDQGRHLQHESEEINILETEEHGVGEEEFQSVESKRDIAKFREGFRKWLAKPGVAGEQGANNFILLFDIFWRILQAGGEGVKRSEFEKEWMEKTGLSFGSFRDYFMRLPDMVEQFIMSHSTELGDKNIFVDLMNAIRAERTERERKERRQKERARPAMVSSLNTAAVEEDEKLTCQKCRRTSDASDSNNLQCPHCGGNMTEAKTASTGLECWFFEYQPGKWYYLLENWDSPKGAWDWREYADAYGPFGSKDAAIEHLQDNHANPGGWGASEYDPNFAKDKLLAKLVADAPSHTRSRSRWGSSKIAQKLLRGDQLTPDMARQVKDAFIYRWTSDNKRRGDVYHCDKCDVRNNPYVNTTSAEGHQHPTIPLKTDDEWLREHAFYFTNAGKLLPRRHAVPAYLAPQEEEPILASVAHKFAMEKAAYNPGKGEYIYQSDVYCEPCGVALKRRLDKHGYTPANPSDESSWDSDKYPKGPYFNQEADGPEHCARCGEFLENPLTDEGYRYLNQMILEHEEDGKGSDPIIEEWKAFYPEREDERYTPGGEVSDALHQIEQDTDKDFLRGMGVQGASKTKRFQTHNRDKRCDCKSCEKYREEQGSKKAMIPHEFNDADGQAIRNETWPDTDYVSGEADTAEFRERRVGGEDEPSVARTILEQLGGRKFIAMTGAKNFIDNGNGLSFRLPGSGGFTKNGINVVRIELTPGDTYKVTFSRLRGGKDTVVSEHDDIYVDSLREVFERVTGLATSLGTMDKSGAGSNSGNDDDRGAGDLWREDFYEHRTEGISPDGLMSGIKKTELASQKSEEIANRPPLSIGQMEDSLNAEIARDLEISRDTSATPEERRIALQRAAENKARLVELVPPRIRKTTPLGDSSRFKRGADEQWKCMDCQHEGPLDPKGGGCEVCGSQAVHTVPVVGKPVTTPMRETSPIETQKRMVPRRSRPLPLSAGKTAEYTQEDWERDEAEQLWLDRVEEAKEFEGEEKTAQGSGNTTVTMQEQNVTDPMVPGKSQPMAVPDAIDQGAGPHSPNAPATAPRTPAIQPRIVNVPPGTESEAEMKTGARYLEEPNPEEETGLECPRCHGSNIDIDATEGGYSIYCEDCEQVTHIGNLAPASGIGQHAVEPEIEFEEPPEEPPFDAHVGVYRGPHDPAIPFSDNAPAPAGELSPDTLPHMSEEEKEHWLEKHGWMRENEHHGATWWMDRQMWYKKDHEESIPYQSTDDAIEKELDLAERAAERGVQAAAAAPAPVHPNVQQNMNLVRPQEQAPGPGGTTVAITPGMEPEEEPGLKRHTIEPELPNAKYHMMSALVAAEEQRITKKAFGGLSPPCGECGEIKPDVMWHEFPEFGDVNDPAHQLEGYYCEDCALGIAQDI